MEWLHQKLGLEISGLDLFAWIVLIVLLLSTITVICIMGWIPGHIARLRHHPWAEAVSAAGWITLIFGFVFWPIAFVWAYVDIPARKPEAGQ